ncbi:MAG: ROK family protein [Candidatus Pelethousia sp.]|nr:ROK family protein [Candidatus Pelethousia sp.]
MMYRIGVDIGGTNIALGLLDEKLELKDARSIPFQRGGERVAALIAGQAGAMLEKVGAGKEDLSCIGIAVPGSIDPVGELVIHAYNLDFHNEPLRARIQTHFSGIPVTLGNDADAAVLAELYKGALQGCKTAALYTIGTGIGGGYILGGRMFRGGRGNGIEPGHAVLVDGGVHCTCGVLGCVESYCSATALIREANKAMGEHRESLLWERTMGDSAAMTAKLAIDTAKDGDKAALAVFHTYVGHLGSAIASVMNMLDMEIVAIGGGVSGAGEFLFEPLRKDVDSKCFFKNHGAVVPAQMGNAAGMVGAAMFYHNAHNG